MSRLVIDASVAIKWVVEEEGTEEALSLRTHDLIAPDLLVAETANILWKKARLGELTPKEAEMAARLLARADIELAPMRPLWADAVHHAAALDHPAYDCVYLALALTSGVQFVSADSRFLKRVAERGDAVAQAAVVSLGDAGRI